MTRNTIDIIMPSKFVIIISIIIIYVLNLQTHEQLGYTSKHGHTDPSLGPSSPDDNVSNKQTTGGNEQTDRQTDRQIGV
jgi:hypothetical protein